VDKPVGESTTAGGNSVSSPSAEPGEERLIADLRRHAPGSMARLHRLYAVGIYNLALRMVHRREDAEDITHDVLIRAYERLPRHGELRLRPWLYRVTLNRCYDHLRAAARRRPADTNHHPRDMAAVGDPFEQAELGTLFARTLQTLSARQQAALLLKDVHGFSTVELAAMLEVTPGSAEVLLARARASFRARFADFAGIEPQSLPAWIGASLVLPFVALPAALLSPPLPPVHALPGLSHTALSGVCAAPVGVAGGGLCSAVGNSAALKLAAVLAAAATMATGVSDAHRLADRPAPRAPATALAATAHPARSATARTGAAAQSGVTRHAARPAPSATPAAVSAAVSPSPAAGTPSASPPAPSPSDAEMGDTSCTPSPNPTATAATGDSASPSPTPTISPSATTSPSATDSPTATASPPSQ
jgi:RNA polymerase sigma-70 factor (ECF subfamily)